MKANELMIGDWVMFDHNPVRVAILGAADKSIGLAAGKNVFGQPFSIIEPIPLTPEILKKIGFVRFYVNYWKMQVGNAYIELRPTEGNMAIWLDYDEDNDGVYADYILPYPDNLHELQHALRLCGIEKEIKL